MAGGGTSKVGDLLFSSLFLRRRFRLLLSKVSGKVKEEQTMLFWFPVTCWLEEFRVCGSPVLSLEEFSFD